MTNAEKLAQDTERLADLIRWNLCRDCPAYRECKDILEHTNCKETLIAWLQSEAKEDKQ